jgi:hypothetical protein
MSTTTRGLWIAVISAAVLLGAIKLTRSSDTSGAGTGALIKTVKPTQATAVMRRYVAHGWLIENQTSAEGRVTITFVKPVG